MKKFLLSIAVIVSTSVFYTVQAQDLTISGGNNVSAMICANGNVFTWGMNYWEVNSQKAGNGNLGNGSTDDYGTLTFSRE